jgi:2-keto-4-pentenoate hydratase/2-oxohepta-3-ene-1,7-dioic acid hydratase in catechol pathway
MDASNTIRDLSDALQSVPADQWLSPQCLSMLAKLDTSQLPAAASDVRLGAPLLVAPRNFIGIGLNYRDHAQEAQLPLPKEPIVFLKSLGSIGGPNDDVVIPRGSVKTDYECELGVVIGVGGSYISEDAAIEDHVAGYTIVNDVSEREFQLERGGQWDKGKSAPTFGPIGPYVVTKALVPDPHNLGLWCEVDGVRMQNSNTRELVFGVRKLVSYVSQFIELFPGDIIATGTPAGVGLGRKPPTYLKAGQVKRKFLNGLT